MNEATSSRLHLSTLGHRTRAILRAAFVTLRQHPRLLWFPILSGLSALVVLLVGFSLTRLGDVVAANPTIDLGPFFDPWGSGAASDAGHRSRWFAGAFVVFGVHLSTITVAVGLAHAACEAMAGRSWSVQLALSHAWRRLPAIATVAVLQTGIERLFKRRADRNGPRRTRLPGKLALTAWAAATYLVVPVLAREQRTGFQSVKRSADLLRSTWKKAFMGRLILGWFWLAFALSLAIPAGLCAWLGIDDGRAIAAIMGTPLVLGGLAALVLSSLDIIYRTALYVFATEGVVPEPFDDPALHDIWHVE